MYSALLAFPPSPSPSAAPSRYIPAPYHPSPSGSTTARASPSEQRPALPAFASATAPLPVKAVAPVFSLSATAAPFSIAPALPAQPQQAPEVVDLASLHALYRKSPSSASALLTCPPPPALTLLLLLDELLVDVQRPLACYHPHVQLRLLSVLLAWLSSSLALSPVAVEAPALLSCSHSPHLSYVLQALSARSFPEWRLLIAKAVLTVVAASAAAPSLSSSPHLLSMLSTLGQLAMERVGDEDAGVRAVYREVVGWCGVRCGVYGENLGLTWHERQERERQRMRREAEEEERKAKPGKRYRKDSDRTDRTVRKFGGGSREGGEEEGEADAVIISGASVASASSRSQSSAPGSEDGREEEDGSEGVSSSDEDEDDESEDEHGHVSHDEGKEAADNDDDEEEQGGTTKVELVRRVVMKAKQDKAHRERMEEKEMKATPDIRSAALHSSATISARRSSYEHARASLSTDGYPPSDDDDAVAAPKGSKGARDGTFSHAPSARSASSTVSSSGLPLPVTLSSASALRQVLSAPQSVSFRSHQFELTFDCFLNTAERLLNDDASGKVKVQDNNSNSSSMSHKLPTTTTMEAALSRDWIEFALFLHHGTSAADLAVASPALLSLISTSAHLQCYYALTSACKFLLCSQLKSPYGREVATLTALDRVLSHLLRARHSSERKDKGGQDHANAKHWTTLSLQPSSFTSIASTSSFFHTLTLLWSLQKFIALAISPSLSSLASVSSSSTGLYEVERSSTLFFQQNASSCLTFFSRSTAKLLAFAISCEDTEAVICLAQQWMRSLKSQLRAFITAAEVLDVDSIAMDAQHLLQVKELVKCTAALAFAALQRRDVRLIEDLVNWAHTHFIRLPRSSSTQLFSPPFLVNAEDAEQDLRPMTILLPWLEGMRLQAEGRLEEAVASFMRVLKPSKGDPSFASTPRFVLSQSTALLVHRCLRHCLAALRDWSTLLHWLVGDEERLDERQLVAAWLQWERRVRATISRPHSPTALEGLAPLPISLRLSPNSVDPKTPVPVAGETSPAEPSVTSSPPLLLEPDDKAKLMEQLTLHSLMAASASAPSSNLSALSSASVTPLLSPLSDTSPLLQLRSWDVSSTLALDTLVHSSAAFSPLSAAPYSSPSHRSLLLRLSTSTALAQRSLSPMQPFFISCQEPLFASAVGIDDCLLAVDVLQALWSSSPASQASSSSRSFMLTAMRQTVYTRNFMLCDRLFALDALMSFSPTVEHRSELVAIKAQLSLERGEAEAALTSLWDLHKSSRDKFPSASAIAAFVPVPLVAPFPAVDVAVGAAPASSISLQSTRFLDLFTVVSAILRVHSERDESQFDPEHEQLTRTALRLVSSRLFPSDAAFPSSPSAGLSSTAAALSSPSAALIWLQSYAVTSACRFSPRSSRAWQAYGLWCAAQRKRLMAAESSPLLLEDDDWVAIHHVVSAFESLSASGSGERLSTSIFQAAHSAVAAALQERPAPAASAPPLQSTLASTLSVSLPAVFAAGESGGDGLSLPQSFVRSIVAIAERRARLVLAFSRASLASLVASLLHAPTRDSASFHSVVDVPLLLVDTALSSPLDHCDILLASFLSVPASALTFILPQLFAALSSLLHQPRESDFSLSLIRALLIKAGEVHPDAVVFELHARLQESQGRVREGWKRLVVDIRGKQATVLEEEEKRRRAPTLIQPTALPTAIDPASLVSPTSTTLTESPSSASFTSLLSTVERLVHGLSQVGSLPEDELLSALRSIQSDLPLRVKLLMDEMEEEAEEGEVKEWERDRRRAERYHLIFAPLISHIVHLPRALSTTLSSPHQQHVRRRFKRTFASLASLLSSPSPSSLGDPLAFAQSIAETLNELKRALSKAHRLSLKDVSPTLAVWTASELRLPGLRREEGGPRGGWGRGDFACIDGFSESFDIIRTKTRPKRLLVLASDGCAFPYLLKSKEDLHVDSRLMQAVEATNLGLARQRLDCAGRRCKEAQQAEAAGDAHLCVDYDLYAPTYPVIPLSSSLGLLRWLEHSTPIFDLHRAKRKKGERERHRGERKHRRERERDGESVRGEVEKEAKEVKGNELYQQKVAAYLVAAGLSTRMPRKDWPLPILRRVYRELKRDVSDDMIDSYLSFLSTSPHHLLSLRAAFTSSMSTMSMLGYALGLGDRHLGNLLVDSDGRLVHIDYNICLDRGRRLPVPEIVPFRLTGVMRGVGGEEAESDEEGVRGAAMRMFRVQSEQVMGWLRESRRPLLSLLSTFVHSSIVDWRGDSSGKRASTAERRAVVQDSLIAMALLVQRLRRRLARIDAVYSGLMRQLQPVDLSMRRMRLLEDIIEREERGEVAEVQCEEMRGLLAWEMEALSKAKAQLQSALSSATRKALTNNTTAQREELERVRGEIDYTATRYETATDLQLALSSPHTAIWLRSLFEIYGQEQSDWLHGHISSTTLATLLTQHSSLIKALRPLLTASSKAAAPLSSRQLCAQTRQLMESLQRFVVHLSSKAASWRDWAAALSVDGGGQFVSLQEMCGELRKNLISLPQRLDEDVRKAAEHRRADDTADAAAEMANELAPLEVKEEGDEDGAEEGSGPSEFARLALRRAGEKLAGVEPAYGQWGQVEAAEREADGVHAPLSVRDHVEWLIEEAASVDNLCRMYEGWAPWI